MLFVFINRDFGKVVCIMFLFLSVVLLFHNFSVVKLIPNLNFENVGPGR